MAWCLKKTDQRWGKTDISNRTGIHFRLYDAPLDGHHYRRCAPTEPN
jgi:hypothetical protein